VTDEQCLFCRIVAGELSVEPLLATEHTLAVLNTLEPMSRGHVVFFPKRHAVKVHELPDECLADLMAAVKRVAHALEVEDYNILSNNGAIAGQTVFHAHFHLIPKWSEDEGLRYDRTKRPELDQREIERKLREALSISEAEGTHKRRRVGPGPCGV